MKHLVLKKLRSALPFLVWVLLFIAVWEIGAYWADATKRTPANVLPHLTQIFEAANSDRMVSSGETASQLVMSGAQLTLSRAALGFLVGALSGFVLALFMKISRLVEKTVFPYLMIIQMIPILGMAPIILSITRDINVSRIAIAAILTFFPVATGTLAGFNSVEKSKYDLMHVYAASPFEMYTKVLIPTSIPYLFTGLKIAAPMAITASILVDTLQGDRGLGTLLSQSLKHAMSIYVFWIIVFFSALVGILSAKVMGGLEKLCLPHKRKHLSISKEGEHG